MLALALKTSCPVLMTGYLAAMTAWPWAVLLAGRALPWQATSLWILVFAVAAALFAAWWWRFLRRARQLAPSDRMERRAITWGGGPALGLALLLLGSAYGSNSFYEFVAFPQWRLQVVAALAILTVAVDTAQTAAVAWLTTPGAGVRGALLNAFSGRAEVVALASLAAVGILQAAGSVEPLGDDIWHYTAVSDALLRGELYPIPASGEAGIPLGTGATYPALPLFPMLVAGSYLVFGRTLVGLAIPNVVATAVFPLAMYAACKSITGNRPVAYAAASLLSMLPAYQMHVLGGAEPDTLFIVLLLVGAALAGRAYYSPHPRWWIGLGAAMGLASLTRHEGTAYAGALFLPLLLFHPARRRGGLSVITCLAVLAPFVAVHYSASGSFWPTTFGARILRWENLEANLALLQSASLPWFAQVSDVENSDFLVILALAGVAAGLGTLALSREALALAAIPLAGMANIAAVLFMPPILVYPDYPPDFLRHIAYGLTFSVIAMAFAARAALQLAWRHSKGLGFTALVALLLTTAAGLSAESARLAKPTWYFGGEVNLLWHGNFYLLSDLWGRNLPLPATGDGRSGEQLRNDLRGPLEEFRLARANRSEPYYYAALMLALLGLLYSLAPSRGAGVPDGEPTPSRLPGAAEPA